MDLDRLGAALRGDVDDTARRFANIQHGQILKAMNLDAARLITAFRWPHSHDAPGTVRIQSH